MTKRPKSVAEIDAFITMLRVACENNQVRETLERLVAMPDLQRQAVVDA